jgi:hypothetical protein
MTKFITILATFSLATVASAQLVNAPHDAYQVRYATNFLAGDSAVNLTNVGAVNGFEPAGNICADVYVFAQDQQLVACCACPLTPNHLKTLSVEKDLINNTLTPGVPTAVTIALLASTSCNAATVTAGSLVSGLRAWGTTLHAAPGGGYGVSETEFSPAPLSVTELAKATSYCGFIQAIGSGYGICSSCRQGAQGSVKQ